MRLIFFLLLSLCGASACTAATATATQVHRDTEFTEFFRRTKGWTAGDGALSVPLADGRVLWLFGDSHIDDIDPATGTMPCLFQTRNAGMLQDTNTPNTARTLVGSKP